jgi:hypothetical protein
MSGVITLMRLSHINVSMPKGCEDIARSFYGGLPGLREIPKAEPLRVRGGVWFDASGLDIHLSVEERRVGAKLGRSPTKISSPVGREKK